MKFFWELERSRKAQLKFFAVFKSSKPTKLEFFGASMSGALTYMELFLIILELETNIIKILYEGRHKNQSTISTRK